MDNSSEQEAIMEIEQLRSEQADLPQAALAAMERKDDAAVREHLTRLLIIDFELLAAEVLLLHVRTGALFARRETLTMEYADQLKAEIEECKVAIGKSQAFVDRLRLTQQGVITKMSIGLAEATVWLQLAGR